VLKSGVISMLSYEFIRINVENTLDGIVKHAENCGDHGIYMTNSMNGRYLALPLIYGAKGLRGVGISLLDLYDVILKYVKLLKK